MNKYSKKSVSRQNNQNKWGKMVGHTGCIFPCYGKPILKTIPGKVWVAAHCLPVFLQCSECGYAPSPERQPELIKRYLEYLLKNNPIK